MDREFFDIKLEKTVLRCLANSEEYLVKILKNGFPDEKIFADLSLRILYKILIYHFQKYSKVPDKLIAKKYVLKLKKSKELKEKVLIVVENIYESTPTKNELKNFDSYFEELKNIYKFRAVQNHIKKLIDHVDRADLEQMQDEVNGFHITSNDDDIEEFDFADGFSERLERIKKFKENYLNICPIPTGVEELDFFLDGGIFPDDYAVVVGSSSSGKSMFLQNFCISAAKNKKNGLLFTIEMNKIEAAMRMDANISGIPTKKFKNPYLHGFNDEAISRWGKRINKIKKHWGAIHIVSFSKGATVKEIEAKAQEYVRKTGKKLDYIAIDYLNDLKPSSRGKYSSDKDWQAQSEISWDLRLLNKHFVQIDGSRGVSVVTAAILKGGARELTRKKKGLVGQDDRRVMDEEDLGLAKLIYNHSTTCLGIREVSEGVNQIVLMKQRAGEKNKLINVYPNFKFGRFHDKKKAEEIEAAYQREVRDAV